MATVQTVGVSQTQEQVVVAFPNPVKGVIQGVSEIDLPTDALWIGENLHFFEGECRQRPSWNLKRDTGLATLPTALTTPVGLFTGHRATTRDQFVLVGGTNRVYVYADAQIAGLDNIASPAWNLVKAWATTNARTAQVRFTEIATGTPLVTDVVVCNSVDVPFRFTLSSPTSGWTTPTNLSIPNSATPKDACTSSDRIIVLTDTEAYWSGNLSFTFGATSVKSFAESLDLAIAIRPFGSLNVGVWKERSIWAGIARGGADAAYFSWRLFKWVDGPAAPNALVTDTTGSWYWITRTGRVVKMAADSFEVTYPGDGVWPIVRKEIASTFAGYAISHAVYRPIHDEVWFFYSTGTVIDRAIVLCHAGSDHPAAFIANFVSAFDPGVSARISENRATTTNYEDEAAVVTVETNPTLYVAQELQATGTDTFTTLVQTGLQSARGPAPKGSLAAAPRGDTHRLESAEVFLRRGAGVHPGTATINLSPISSSILDVQAGTIGTAVAIPGLNSTSPVKAVTGLSATGRFFGYKMTGANADSIIRYLGAYLRGRRTT